MEQVDQQRAAAQEARADDQALLAGLWEQLETARAEASIATRQQDATNNRATTVRIERDRHHAISNAHDHAERGLRQ